MAEPSQPSGFPQPDKDDKKVPTFEDLGLPTEWKHEKTIHSTLGDRLRLAKYEFTNTNYVTVDVLDDGTFEISLWGPSEDPKYNLQESTETTTIKDPKKVKDEVLRMALRKSKENLGVG